jgi:hypothetical protein
MTAHQRALGMVQLFVSKMPSAPRNNCVPGPANEAAGIEQVPTKLDSALIAIQQTAYLTAKPLRAQPFISLLALLMTNPVACTNDIITSVYR